MFFHFELLGGKYHINANFCYNHLFTLYYVLKELKIQRLFNTQGIACKIFLYHINSLLYLISNYPPLPFLIYTPN